MAKVGKLKPYSVCRAVDEVVELNETNKVDSLIPVELSQTGRLPATGYNQRADLTKFKQTERQPNKRCSENI